MQTTYAQKNETTQRAADNTAAAVHDNSPQSESLQRKVNLTNTSAQNGVVQRLPLTALGEDLIQNPNGYYNAAKNLMLMENINRYCNGMCYDTVALMRFLRGAGITLPQLVATNAQGWRPIFNFTNGILWSGGGIQPGVAVGFENVTLTCGLPEPKTIKKMPELQNAPPIDANNIFHAALSLGGTIVRGVNGYTLGDFWTAAGDCDLSKLPPVGNNVYCDVRGNRYVRVWISYL